MDFKTLPFSVSSLQSVNRKRVIKIALAVLFVLGPMDGYAETYRCKCPECGHSQEFSSPPISREPPKPCDYTASARDPKKEKLQETDCRLRKLDREFWFLIATGCYAKATVVENKALRITEKAYGANHPCVASCLSNLARLYPESDSAKAESLYKRALAIDEKALGPKHPSVAKDLDNIADIYRKTGREKEAKKLEKRAAAIRASDRFRCLFGLLGF